MPGQLAQDVLGSRRDISDKLVMVDARSTPLFSMIPKGGQLEDSLTAEWPMDKNLDPQRTAQKDGEDVASFDNAMKDYGVGSNYLQWYREAAMVGKLALKAQNQAGVPNKLAKAVAKKMVQLKRDIEISLGSDDAAVQATGAVGGRSRGIGDYIKATAQTVLPIPAPYLTPAASIDTTATASLTEAIIQGVLESQWNERGEIKTYSCFCGSAFKKTFRTFQQTTSGSTNTQASMRTFSQAGDSKKITWSVDIYEGDWGTLELIPTQWLAYLDASGATQAAVTKARAYVMDMDMWEWLSNQKPERQDFPDLGGGPRFAVDAIGGLKCANPRGEAKFAATS